MSTRRRAMVALAAVTSVLGGLTTAAVAAAAEPVTAGTLTWSIKSSTSRYHLNHPNGMPSIVVADGATPAGTLTSVSQVPQAWTWPLVSGTYDSASKNLTVQYGGSVLYQDPSGVAVAGPGPSGGASPFTYLKIANPKVSLDFTTDPVTRTLRVEVTDSPGARPTRILYSSRVGPSAGLSPATPSGGAVRYADLGVLISDAYRNAFGGGFLPPGAIADPFSFQVTVDAAPAGKTTDVGRSDDGTTGGAIRSPTARSGSAATPTTDPSGTLASPQSGPSTDTDPDAPGDPTDDLDAGGAPDMPPTRIADESSTPSVTRSETPLGGQTVVAAVRRVDDSGRGGGLALFGVACLAALVAALAPWLILRSRRSQERSAGP